MTVLTTVHESLVSVVIDLLNEGYHARLRIEHEKQAIADLRRIAIQELQVSPVDFNRMVKEGLQRAKKTTA